MQFTGDEIFIDGTKEQRESDIFFHVKTTGPNKYFVRMSKNATAKDAYMKAVGSVGIDEKIERVSKVTAAYARI